jgi:hypothetical protein
MAFEGLKESILVDERYIILEKKLLKLGGEKLVYMPCPLLDDIIQHGALFDFERRRPLKGVVGRCHDNALKLVLRFPKKYQMMTGFALTDDGLWRCHSWCINDKTVVETTAKRIKYYGIVLDASQMMAMS